MSAGRVITTVTGKVADAIFPRRCAGCGRRGAWVCDECAPLLATIAEPVCQRCGEPTSSYCVCHELGTDLDRLRSVAWYEGWLRTAITHFKYEGEFARADHLAAMMGGVIRAMPADVVLIPVPLHPNRERWRGYNQAALLAERISGATGLHVERTLVRTVETRQQVGLGANDRQQNVRNAFALAPRVEARDRRFVLIDDVCTTGATLGACAKALKAAGAAFVGGVTLARER